MPCIVFLNADLDWSENFELKAFGCDWRFSSPEHNTSLCCNSQRRSVTGSVCRTSRFRRLIFSAAAEQVRCNRSRSQQICFRQKKQVLAIPLCSDPPNTNMVNAPCRIIVSPSAWFLKSVFLGIPESSFLYLWRLHCCQVNFLSDRTRPGSKQPCTFVCTPFREWYRKDEKVMKAKISSAKCALKKGQDASKLLLPLFRDLDSTMNAPWPQLFAVILVQQFSGSSSNQRKTARCSTIAEKDYN